MKRTEHELLVNVLIRLNYLIFQASANISLGVGVGGNYSKKTLISYFSKTENGY